MIVNCHIYKKQFEQKGIDNQDIFIKRDLFSRTLGRIFRFLHLPFLNNIPYFETKDKTIIIFDGCIKDKRVFEIIAKRHSDKRLIFYYWNPVSVSINPKKIPDCFEKWSYSFHDSEKYHLHFNDTFTFKEIFDGIKYVDNVSFDVVFVGKNKKRKNKLLAIKQSFENKNIKCLFHITPTHPKIQKIGFQKQLSYAEVLELDNKSMAILDYYTDQNAGLSLRAVESAFLNKKLISNNFFLGTTLIEEGITVFEKELSDTFDFCTYSFSDKAKSYFDFNTWITRFRKV